MEELRECQEEAADERVECRQSGVQQECDRNSDPARMKTPIRESADRIPLYGSGDLSLSSSMCPSTFSPTFPSTSQSSMDDSSGDESDSIRPSRLQLVKCDQELPRVPEQSILSLLPVELWVFIMRLPGASELAFTCRFAHDIWLRHVGYDRLRIRSAEVLTEVCKAVEERGLNISSCRLQLKNVDVSAEQFKLLGKAEKLVLGSVGSLDSNQLRHLCALDSLTLDRCTVTRDALCSLRGLRRVKLVGVRISEEVLESFSSLEYVRLFSCTGITDSGLAHLRNAHSVTLSSCKEVTDEGIQALGGIARLKIWHMDWITDSAFSTHSKLEILNIKCCRGVTDASFVHFHSLVTVLVSLCPNITGSNVHLLSGARNVSVPFLREVTDEGVKALAGVRTISLAGCHRVTDEGVKSLAGAESVVLQEVGITDAGVAVLAGVSRISLRRCTKVTDKGVIALKGVKDIDLSGCNISDQALEALEGVQTINLSESPNVTDAGLAYLSSAYKVRISSCPITCKGLKALANVQVLVLRRCDGVFDDAFAHLTQLRELTLIVMVNVSAAALQHMKCVRDLNIFHCHLITSESLSVLTHVKKLTVGACYSADKAMIRASLPNTRVRFDRKG